MTQDRAQLLITAVDQTRAAFDSIRGNLGKLGDEAGWIETIRGVGYRIAEKKLSA